VGPLSDDEIRARRGLPDADPLRLRIDPFVPAQTKFREADGRRVRVVGYGPSGFGHDVRLGDTFRFLAGPDDGEGLVLDPLDHAVGRCYGPPTVRRGPFVLAPGRCVLAETVERFRIPDDCIAQVFGKSTWARCFTGDTRVALVDGTSPTFAELAARPTADPVFGYGIGPFGRLMVTDLHAPRLIGTGEEVVRVLLDDGSHIDCTPDHEFLTRSGLMIAAAALKAGQSLMPLYRKLSRGYEKVYQPLTKHHIDTHVLADEWNIRNGFYEAGEHEHRHHVDHDRRNNSPFNICRVPAADHLAIHNATYYGPGFDQISHGQAVSTAMNARLADPVWAAGFSARMAAQQKDFWSDPRNESRRAAILAALAHRMGGRTPEQAAEQKRLAAEATRTPEARAAAGIRSKKAWNSGNQERREKQAAVMAAISTKHRFSEEQVMAALNECGSVKGAARKLGCDDGVLRARYGSVLAAYRGRPINPNNHKVVSVTRLTGRHDVYCLTAPECGNFALASGVFVKNCFVNLNTTALEPGWEGTVTLEVVNLSSLPVRLRPGEGVGQVVFFAGSGPCGVPYYRQPGASYQGQAGPTVPTHAGGAGAQPGAH